ncbi:MAG TPA: ABC transporter permease [Candidatus Sulfotelmatobacter sp.]|nr:ABC transporter permease [Candidatus Sulfotelmatobacter sp.]
MGSLVQDIQYGGRVLLKSPGFAIVAVLTLALGIGANTAIFSIVNTILLRPMPVRDAKQIYVMATQQEQGAAQIMFSVPEYRDIRSQTGGEFSSVMAYTFGLDGLNISGKAERVFTQYVSGNFFSGLGIRPEVGRLILPSEGETAMADPVMVLGYNYWKTRFGGDPGVVGRKVSVNGRPVTIVGVVSKDFPSINSFVPINSYLPLGMIFIEGWSGDFLTNRQNRNVLVLGRAQPNTSPKQLQASLDVVSKRLSDAYPKEEKDLRIQAYPELRARPVPDPKNTAIVISGLFLSLAGLVLLLACANVANILLVRATVRGREMAIRAALGAARIRLIRQLLTESILLALMGGAAGLGLGWLGSSAIGAIPMGFDLVPGFKFEFDWRVFAFAFGAALATGIIVGILPAIRASRGNLANILHEGGRTVVGGRQHIRNVMVTVQVGASLMLLIIAGLFTRSLVETERLKDLGFDPNHVLNLFMDPTEIGYTELQGREFFKNLLDRVRALPGVESASIANSIPMGFYNNLDALWIEGYEPPAGQPAPKVPYNTIWTDYFQTLRIPILRGRVFTNVDDEKGPYVAIINEAMAKTYWPKDDPIGRHFKIGSDPDHVIEVVGITKDSRFQGMTGPINPYFYVPVFQHYAINSLNALQVRTKAAPQAMIPDVEHVIDALAPELPVFDVKTMVESLNTLNGLLFFRLGAVLAALFGILGLVLAVVGVYGVISYSASQKTHEIGIRLALGAQARDILKMVFSQGLLIVGIGVVIGIAAALAAARVVGNFLTVSATDPLTYISVSLVLAVVALLACYIPSYRAMRLDPMDALRHE